MQPELPLPPAIPKIGELYTPGDGAVCEIFNAWQASPGESGVVVRWQRNIKDRKAYYTVPDFLEQFALYDPKAQPDLFESDRDGATSR